MHVEQMFCEWDNRTIMVSWKIRACHPLETKVGCVFADAREMDPKASIVNRPISDRIKHILRIHTIGGVHE